MHKLNLSLFLFIFLFVGCAAKPKVDNTPLISVTATPTPTLDISEALPISEVDKSFSSLSKNDLIDGFYYYDDSPPQQLQFQQANANSSTLRIQVAVRGDKACYLATGLGGTDVEIESLVRERAGVWRGLHSNRYFTQPSFNSLIVYASETDKIAEYINKSIKTLDLRSAIAQFAARATKVNNIVRLTLPYGVESIYRGICLNYEPVYFRGKLAKIESDSEIKKIETSLNEMLADISISPTIESTPTPVVSPISESTPQKPIKTLRP